MLDIFTATMNIHHLKYRPSSSNINVSNFDKVVVNKILEEKTHNIGDIIRIYTRRKNGRYLPKMIT